MNKPLRFLSACGVLLLTHLWGMSLGFATDGRAVRTQLFPTNWNEQGYEKKFYSLANRENLSAFHQEASTYLQTIQDPVESRHVRMHLFKVLLQQKCEKDALRYSQGIFPSAPSHVSKRDHAAALRATHLFIQKGDGGSALQSARFALYHRQADRRLANTFQYLYLRFADLPPLDLTALEKDLAAKNLLLEPQKAILENIKPRIDIYHPGARHSLTPQNVKADSAQVAQVIRDLTFQPGLSIQEVQRELTRIGKLVDTHAAMLTEARIMALATRPEQLDAAALNNELVFARQNFTKLNPFFLQMLYRLSSHLDGEDSNQYRERVARLAKRVLRSSVTHALAKNEAFLLLMQHAGSEQNPDEARKKLRQRYPYLSLLSSSLLTTLYTHYFASLQSRSSLDRTLHALDHLIELAPLPQTDLRLAFSLIPHDPEMAYDWATRAVKQSPDDRELALEYASFKGILFDDEKDTTWPMSAKRHSPQSILRGVPARDEKDVIEEPIDRRPNVLDLLEHGFPDPPKTETRR